jgi:hypothetical protein
VAGSFQSEKASVVRHNRWWLALGASPYLVAFALLVAAIGSGVWQIAIPVIHASLFGTLGLFLAYRANRDPVSVPGGLRVDDQGVYQGDRLLARRADLQAGFLTPKGGQVIVRLKRGARRPSVRIKLESVEEGRALLRALDLDASQTAVELRAASELLAWSMSKQLVVLLGPVFGVVATLFALAAGVGAGPGFAVAGPALVLGIVAWIFGLLFAPTRVRIGVDGIATRWLGKHRFIPFAKVRGVRSYEERSGGKVYLGVALTLDGGEIVKIPAGQKGFMSVDPSELEERIRQAHEIHERGGAGAVDPRLLARGNRGVGEWIAALRAIGAGANADLRTPPVPQDELLRIAEDASAEPLVRAGAAVAAGVAPDARKRLRVAAQTTASPALRVALERVSAEDASEETLAEALGDLDQAEGGGRARS